MRKSPGQGPENADHPAPPWELDDSRARPRADLRPRAMGLHRGVHLPEIWWAVAAFLTACDRIAASPSAAAWLLRNAIPAPAGIVSRGAETAAGTGDRIPAGGAAHSKPPLPSRCSASRRQEILLPENSPLWSAPKLRAVFVHELAHWKRRDHLWQHLGRIAACLFWWNPLVKLAMREDARPGRRGGG